MRHFGELSGPDDELGAVGEIPAGDIGWGIGLSPCHHIENLEAKPNKLLLHAEDIMVGSGNPYRGVVFHMSAHGCQPPQVKRIHLLRCFRFVPISLIHTNDFPALTADASGREEIWRVGKNHVKAKRELRQRFVAITLNKGEVVGRGFVVWCYHYLGTGNPNFCRGI